MYAQVELKPKKRTARPPDPNPPKQEPGVEYASIAYQPKDAAEKSQAAAEKSQEAADRAQKKTKKKHPDAGMYVGSILHRSCLKSRKVPLNSIALLYAFYQLIGAQEFEQPCFM